MYNIKRHVTTKHVKGSKRGDAAAPALLVNSSQVDISGSQEQQVDVDLSPLSKDDNDDDDDCICLDD